MKKNSQPCRFHLRRETLLPLSQQAIARVAGGLPNGTTTCNDTTSDLCPITTMG